MRGLVTFVIPVRNDAAGLPFAVESALEQEVESGSEVLVCVGPSDDATYEVATKLADTFETVRVLLNPSGKIPTALNLGMSEALGEFLVRVDARTVLPPGYVRRALTTMSQTGAANIGAVQRPIGRTLVQRSIAMAMALRAGSGGVAYRSATRPGRVDTAFLGVFHLGRLRDAGGWDDAFLRNEDAELNLRLAKRGGVWLDPSLVVDYEPRSSLSSLARQYFDYGWWRRVTVRKHAGSIAARQLVAPGIVLALLISALVAAVAPWVILVWLVYASALVMAGLGANGSVLVRLILPAVLAVMHLSWGLGFLASTLFGPRPLAVANAGSN